MIVSFDLDDTLFINPEKCSAEKSLHFPLNIVFRDRLRAGTVKLISELKKKNIRVWIYTTSFRSEWYIKTLFRCYGINIDYIVNSERHKKEVQGEKSEPMPSKYPSRYRIDLHIDDDISVAENGKIYGFKVYLISENNPKWVDEILNQVNKIKRAV